ncbi:hypothetical protein D9619_006016 [Psilocybe cf. subviscida]|uniref:Uncharacterized protein n=1 Tax=Psilocybe cf. subviscida TaxID=2480587 RepID=A0A8H5BXC1_9AGAR|nr:hypothetical protein D9619_006016 [Psilocybe cf. subviscida]
MRLQILKDPFVVDLSTGCLQVHIVDDAYTTVARMRVRNTFRETYNPKQPLLSGCATVQFEEYPGLPSGDNPCGPLVAMRILEMLTPVKRLSNDDRVQLPQEGKLLYWRTSRVDMLHGDSIQAATTKKMDRLDRADKSVDSRPHTINLDRRSRQASVKLRAMSSNRAQKKYNGNATYAAPVPVHCKRHLTTHLTCTWRISVSGFYCTSDAWSPPSSMLYFLRASFLNADNSSTSCSVFIARLRWLSSLRLQFTTTGIRHSSSVPKTKNSSYLWVEEYLVQQLDFIT